MQKQRLKASVFPARCGKKSFGTDWENTVSTFRQGLLLHCSKSFAGALRFLPNDNESCLRNTEAFPPRTVFLRPEGQIQTTGDTLLAHGGIRTREKRAEQAQRSKDSSGIHFGTSWCTAVKDQLKHWLEATLQAYFTNPYPVFHGKKAANSYLSPQLNCFSSFSTTNFRKGSGSKTSTIGPKERIRITISDSSSCAYLIFTR